MTGFSSRAKLGVAVAAGVLAAVAGTVWVGTRPPPAAPAASAPAAAPSASSAVGKPGAGGKQHAAAPKALDKPLWKELTALQQQALLPLQVEWDQMEGLRKQKWLKIANRYSSMTADEQARVRERMNEWVTMTPEQRRQVRENFARTQKIGSGNKSAQWEEYQQLPDEQKKQLAEAAAVKKQVANLPTLAQSKMKTVAPIKKNVSPPSIAPITATPTVPAVPVPIPAATPAAGAAAASASVPAAAPASATSTTTPAVNPASAPAPTNVK
jgi:hypothetical protein